MNINIFGIDVDRTHLPAPATTPFADQGNPMRFFNSGVEIAHDGSPVSEILGTPSQPVGNVMTQLTPTGDPTVSASDAGAIEANEAAGGRGLPRFSKGTMVEDCLPATTPSSSSRPWEGARFQGTHNEDFLRCTSPVICIYITFYHLRIFQQLLGFVRFP